jgi:ATP-dependent Clp protease ATP-binding subunit ClpA
MKSNNTKILIFYGPRKNFDKIIKNKEEIEYFTPLVQEYDKENKKVPLILEGYKGSDEKEIEDKSSRHIKSLVIYSDEYSTITEGAVQNFSSILNFFEIEEIILQNPPLLVVNALKKSYANVIIKNYNYKKITAKNIKTINDNFNKRVIGQEEALNKILKLLLSFVKFPKQNKPIILMFYGPSGVGKTETAKFLSEILGGKILYKQFSMFQNNEFSTYLFGGLHSQNSFSKELLDRESNVILLDEFDKAHPHFYSAFYQLFDEGIFIDKNYKVKLSNAIIICTSNYKSKEEIKEKLGDPIYYRFDSFVEFEELKAEDINKIIDLKYKKYMNELSWKDKNVIRKIKYNGISLKDSLKIYSSKIKNVREIDNLIKELILGELLKNELK